jgi:hypothetical protein
MLHPLFGSTILWCCGMSLVLTLVVGLAAILRAGRAGRTSLGENPKALSHTDSPSEESDYPWEGHPNPFTGKIDPPCRRH